MKKYALLVVLAVVAAGYFYRRELVAVSPAWVKTAVAKIDPSLAAGASGAKAGAGAAAQGQGGHHAGPVAVNVAVAKAGTLPVLRSALGTVTATQSTALSPETAGTIAKVLVADGAEVKAGDLLVQLDDRAIRAQIAKDKAQIDKDQATLDNAQSTYTRTQHLVQTGVSTAQSGDDALAAVKVAQGTLAVDKAAYAVDQVTLANTQIRAPFDGKVGAVQFSTGAFVPAGTKILQIIKMKPVLVQFSLPVEDLPLLRRTQKARVLTVTVSPELSDAASGPQAKGAVTFIDNAVDPASATVTLRASLANDDEMLWPDQPVNVTVQAGTTGELVLVPGVAVMPHVNGSAVFVVTDKGTVESRTVQVALRENGLAGISSGLKAGDRVVTEGQAALTNGAAIRIVPPKAEAGAAGAAGNKHGQADLSASGAAAVSKS